MALRDILYSSFSESRNPLESASEFFEKMVSRYGSNPALSFEIFSEASHTPGLRRVLKKTQDEYANTLSSFLEQIRQKGHVGQDLNLRALTYALIGLWNGIETLMVSGLPVSEAKQAWLEGFKAIFLQPPAHKNL
jgi:hypothetical protein